MLNPDPRTAFDVDFSLAMHNRTGKYFIGRDLLDCASDQLGAIRYWFVPAQRPPSGIPGKVVCKLQGWQVRLNAAGGLFGHRLLLRPRRALLHLEPYTVLTTRLRREDAVLVHDVGPVTHPELFEAALHPAYRAIFAEIARVGPHLVFASRTSADEFARIFPDARPASTRVIYPAIRSDVAAVPPSRPPGIDGLFLMTVGSIGQRKNQLRCIEAFARSGLAATGMRYLLCGGREPGFEAVAEQAARTAGVVMLPYVSDAELAWLYGNASGFVLASLLEGFGIPLAEAISYGIVPAVSRASVLEEVAGEGALLVDPDSAEEIAAAMVRLATMDQAERARRLALLRAAITRFSPAAFCRAWRDALAEMAGPAG